MTLADLEKLMIEKGVTIRTIPYKIKGVYDVCHYAKFVNKPNVCSAQCVYLPEYKREMLVVYELVNEKYAGKFLVECTCGTGSSVHFSAKKYYNTLEEAVASLIEC